MTARNDEDRERVAAEREISAALGLDREQRAVAAAELQALAGELEEAAAVARTRAAAARAGAVALLAAGRGGSRIIAER